MVRRLSLEDVTVCVVTRGDVDTSAILASYEAAARVSVYDNSLRDDVAVYGRYVLIEEAAEPVVIVQDDDVLLSPEAIQRLLDAYEPGKIVANMPPEYRERYTDSCLVGFGSIFDYGLPEDAFANFREACSRGLIPTPATDVFERTCDIVVTVLNQRVLVDLPFEYLPWTRAPNRMYRVPGNAQERRRMLDLCRKVRDA